jgi:hypothetical protein
MGRTLFLTQNSEPFLVVAQGSSQDSGEDFFTETVDVDKLAELSTGHSWYLDPDAEVYRIAKRKGANPFEGMVTVGRAKNCDIVIPLRKVSKFHCFFTPGDSGRYTVADGGSRNGTLLNGERLAKRRPLAVVHGDRIDLGDVIALTFWSAEEFFDKLDV